MQRTPMIAALTLPLAGCGGGGEQTTSTNAAAADDYVARVRALPPGQRDGVLLRAIRDAGRDCQLVTKSEPVPDTGGAPAWAATCDGGGVWLVAFNPGGIATVTGAADAGQPSGK